MPCSPKQLDANRRNASKSTGPKTEAGKARSRGNALTHGLTGAGAVLPDAIAGRAEAFERALIAEYEVQEHDAVGRFLASQAALMMARLEACPEVEAGAIREQIDRAEHEDSWDLDRMIASELLADRLPRRPAVVASRLLESTRGASRLIERLDLIARLAEAGAEIDETGRAMLADLLGIPAELRAADPRIAPDRTAAELAEIARAERDRIAELKADVLDRRDARDRDRTRAGLAADESPAVRRLRGYEASCDRRLRLALDRLRARQAQPPSPVPTAEKRTHSGPDPDRSPAAVPPIPEPEPEPPGAEAVDRPSPPPVAKRTHFDPGRGPSAESGTRDRSKSCADVTGQSSPDIDREADRPTATPPGPGSPDRPPILRNRRARRAAAKRARHAR